MDTIFGLSSGAPPAGIAIVRISGPAARAALESVVGFVPPARMARRARFRDSRGAVLDDGLVLFFPGPASATGEDLAELHAHGGRAVIAALEEVLSALPGLRRAAPGEFTRRAFANGRIDLAEAEGLADLLEAETQLQRAAAIALAGGAFSRQVEGWRECLLGLSAQLEAVLDFADEDDVAGLTPGWAAALGELVSALQQQLRRPTAEALRDGFRVALAGPPNAGKSTLFNALVESEAAITSPLAGTTRDVITRSVALDGVPFSFVDMAGVRGDAEDEVERIGIDRARREIERADLVLWLGPEGEGPEGAWEIEAQADRADRNRKSAPHLVVSALTGEGLDALRAALVARARGALPKPGEVALHKHQRALLGEALAALETVDEAMDMLLVAEHLRLARNAFDRLLGRTSTEEVLDAVFARFCIGK